MLIQVGNESSYIHHASPRNIVRQAAFLGQPQPLPSSAWNASINPQSSRHPSPPANPSDMTTAADIHPSSAPAAVEPAPAAAASRHVGVVCRAIGLDKPQVPSLKLAALQAERRQQGLRLLHRVVSPARRIFTRFV